jgi:hypothetical protein
MKIKNIINFFFLLSLIVSCSSKDDGPKPPEENQKSSRQKVLLIGIDGCRPDALMAASTPNLDKLMANGTFSLDARNEGITYSGPGWSAMFTGVGENKHGVTDNSFSGSNYTRYPHFFKRIKDQYPGGRTVSVSQWHPINNEIAQEGIDSRRNTEDATSDVERIAMAEMGIEQLNALFVHFDDVDHAGHATGFSKNNPNYMAAIEKVDTAIGNIIDAMGARSSYSDEDWLVLVSTDHGGIGTSHGGTTEEEKTIFFIASGNNIPNKEIKKTTTTTTIPAVGNCLNSDTELFLSDGAGITVPSSPTFNFGSDRDFSIECRFRSDAPQDVSIVAKKDWDSGLLPGFVFSFKPSTKKFKVNLGDGQKRVDIETNIISDNNWHTVSATFDRDGLLRVYIDGEFIKSATIGQIGDINNTLPFTMGIDGNSQYAYNGYIAEVRVFDTVLAPAEIDNWKCRVLNDSHANYDHLQGHWKIDEASGNKITDHSPNMAHGTLTGGVWENAKEDKLVAVSDYSNTPRILDIAPTALNHLCIPIEQGWGLDGNSVITNTCKD